MTRIDPSKVDFKENEYYLNYFIEEDDNNYKAIYIFTKKLDKQDTIYTKLNTLFIIESKTISRDKFSGKKYVSCDNEMFPATEQFFLNNDYTCDEYFLLSKDEVELMLITNNI